METFEVSSAEMLEAVKKNIQCRKERLAKLHPNSFEAKGHQTRMHWAERLLQRLEADLTPTTREVVGYFGKGARYASSQDL